MFRRAVITLTIIALALNAVLPVQLYADTDIGYEGRICRDLGILKGETGVVDNAYLETRPSRLQSAIMFLRLKGLEQEALSYRGSKNFKDADVVVWKEGRNVLSYLKEHPEHGWIGDGVNFLPYSPIDSKAYYKVLLESLGYKQKIDGDGDFAWSSVLDFAAQKGLKKVADTKNFTVRSLAIATVEALQTKMNNSSKTLIEYLVDIGDVDKRDAIAAGLYSKELKAEIKAVNAISNSKVEVVFEESVSSSEAARENLYTIKNLDIKDVNAKNENTVVIDTSAMNESSTYTLVFNGRSYSFRGLKKDSVAPKLLTAECKDTDTVELAFDRVLDNITAQDTDTYSIDGATVRSARLDSTNTKVRLLTSGIQSGRSYELKIRGIRNGDGIAAKQITKKFTGKKDTNPPKLSKLTVINNVRLLLEFSDNNGLNKAVAQDRNNYRITYSGGSLDVESVQVKDSDDDGLWDSVELVTESQESGKTYTLIIEDMSDDSVLGNRISKEIKREFRGKARDKSGPTIARNPKAVTNTMIEVEFSDSNALDEESACDESNYELNKGLEIREIRIKDTKNPYSAKGRTVQIITDEMEKSETYTLGISGVRDEFGNEMKSSGSSGYKTYKFKGLAADRTPPYITSVECIDSRTIQLIFDNELDEASAENVANYRIDSLALATKAVLQEDGKTVKLTVSSLSSDRNHTVILNNIKDLSGNALSNVSVGVLYKGNLYDEDPPEIAYIEAVNRREVWIHFEEEVYTQNARMTASGISFEQVGSVLDSGNKVVMKASKPMKDEEYQVTSLTGVWDLRNNAYVLENDLEFYGTDEENDPPEVEDWDQMDVRRFRVVFSEPVLLKGNGTAGIKNPSGVNIGWTARLNPDEEGTDEAYSTVDYEADKDIPADREFRFNFTAMITDYAEADAFDEEDDYYGDSGYTIIDSYLEDDEEPFIEYVEAVTRKKAQIVFDEAIRVPGSYKIIYEDDNYKKKTISIDFVEVDSKDRTRVNIFTKDEMDSEYTYTLIPQSAAADIAGNKLDIKDLEIDFEGSNIMSSDYIQLVEVMNFNTLRVSKSSRIYKINSLYELGSNDGTIGGNLIESTSRISDNVHKVTTKKPLLKDVRYKITVDGLEYKFYGVVPKAGLELKLQERKITFDYMDTAKYSVKAYRADGTELEVYEENGAFRIKDSEKLQNGEQIYIQVIRKADGIIMYGAKVTIDGVPSVSSAKEITYFAFTNLTPAAVGSIDEEKRIIRVSVPYGTDVKNLIATFRHSENSVVKVDSWAQINGQTVNDFSGEVIYTVIAQDGSTSEYKVIVTKEESMLEKKITRFALDELKPAVLGVIDHENRVITLELPNGTDLKALKPTIETSAETTVLPLSGAVNDFTKPVVYTVTARDGSVQEYTVNASVDLSSENSVKSFRFEGIDAVETVIVGGSENIISIKVPYNTYIAELTPIITVSEYAQVTPKSGEVNDFSDDVTYTVTAQNGAKRHYTVKVTVESSKLEKNINSFAIKVLDRDIIGAIDQKKQEITLTVPFGTDLSALIPEISASHGTTIIPGSGEPADFSGPVEYKVTAGDGSSKTYTVKVSVAEEMAKSISSFSFKELNPTAFGEIDEGEGTITVTVPHEANITSLAPTIVIPENTRIVPGSGQPQDFSEPVTYTVTADDGTKKSYTVHVKRNLSSEKSITGFSFSGLGAEGSISKKSGNITITVPYGTDVTNLTASFTASEGAIVKVGETTQKSGETANDFTEPLTYIVIAQDGSTREYTVTVTVAPSDEKLMKEFGILEPGAAGIIDEAAGTISIKVPYGTGLSGLKAVFTSSDNSRVKVGEAIQISGETANDFTNPLTYTVVAQDGSTRSYTVTVVAAAADEKRITGFYLRTANNTVKGLIDEVSRTIRLTVPQNTSLEGLIASFTYLGKAVTVEGIPQISGKTANDFNGYIKYTVTAFDDTTTEYTVIVTVSH